MFQNHLHLFCNRFTLWIDGSLYLYTVDRSRQIYVCLTMHTCISNICTCVVYHMMVSCSVFAWYSPDLLSVRVPQLRIMVADWILVLMEGAFLRKFDLC